MPNHSFNSEIARDYNVDVAIIVNSFDFWLEKNAANNVNYYDGSYWTYNTTKALAQMFDYYSEPQIRRIIKKMVDSEILIEGNYNKSAYDRTKWYALSNAFIDKYKSILRIGKFHLPKSSNQNDEIGEPIPVTIPITIPVNNTVNFEAEKKTASKKQKTVTLTHELRRKFESYYEKEKKSEYYYTSADGKNLKYIINKIKFIIKQKHGDDYIPSDKEIIESWNYILEKIKLVDTWIYDNVSILTINQKFNQLISKINNGRAGNSKGASFEELAKIVQKHSS